MDIERKKEEKIEMEIEHFSHEHPLAFVDIKDEDRVFCQICNKVLSGLIYGCTGCEFYIHKSCAEFPREIQHFFHPCPLILEKDPFSMGSEFICLVCGESNAASFYYHCKQCIYFLDIECALQPPRISEGDNKIQHFSHWHPLELIEIKTGKSKVRIRCNICRKSCQDHTYGCQKCHFYIHDSCMEDLPRQIQHFFHPCPLIFCKMPWHVCNACNEIKPQSELVFRCGMCCFNLHVECALLAFKESEGRKQIQHFLHGHPLLLTDNSDEDGVHCFVCGQDCSSLSYSCSRCRLWLHISCADREVPLEIKHPFHPLHSLQLVVPFMSSCCSACCFDFVPGALYSCDKCDFRIDVACASLTPHIKYHGHQHLLTFFEKTGEKFCCNICETSTDDLFLRCISCNFNLHLYCHPSVPQTIKHKRHLHPLAFTKSFYQDECFPEDDDFYCDACERERRKGIPLYYCTECPFVVHIKCVISEVLAPLSIEDKDDGLVEEVENSAIDISLDKLDKRIADLHVAMKPLEEKKKQLKEEKKKLKKALKANNEELESLSKELEGLEIDRSLVIITHNKKNASSDILH